VFLTIFGSAGDSGEKHLECSGNNLERDQTDNFGFDCVELQRIIHHDNSDKLKILEEERTRTLTRR